MLCRTDGTPFEAYLAFVALSFVPVALAVYQLWLFRPLNAISYELRTTRHLPHVPAASQSVDTAMPPTLKPKQLPKNTIYLWYNKDAQDAAAFYAESFADSRVTAVHHAPATIQAAKRAMC